MSKEKIIVPKLSPNMSEAVLVAWEKQSGEKVAAGEVLYELETEKVVSQIEATVAGKIAKQMVEEGDTVKPGDVVAEIEV